MSGGGGINALDDDLYAAAATKVLGLAEGRAGEGELSGSEENENREPGDAAKRELDKVDVYLSEAAATPRTDLGGSMFRRLDASNHAYRVSNECFTSVWRFASE